MKRSTLLYIMFLVIMLLMAACQPAGPATEPATTPGARPTVEVTTEPTAEPEGERAFGLEELLAALTEAGYSAGLAGEIEQPFFSVSGRVIQLEGADVQVFEYADAEAAAEEAALIAPNGSSIGTTIVGWVDVPHFYTRERLIVLYVGHDELVTGALQSVLGDPVAEGQPMIDPVETPETAAILTTALRDGNYEQARALMADPFVIGYWLSESETLSPDQAERYLRETLLPDPSGITFTADRQQYPDLGDFELEAAFGPDVEITTVLYSQGWGADGLAGALLFLALDENGHEIWHGLIYSDLNFSPPAQ